MTPIRHHRQLSRSLPAGCLTAVLAVTCVCHVQAQDRALLGTRFTNGASVRRVFMDVVEQANRWTVRVKADEQLVAYGTIVRDDGYIVSKASQLNGEIVCRLFDGRELPAQYVGYNSEHDVALLKVDTDNLTAVRWQDQADPNVGRWVVTPDQQGAPNAVGVVSVSRRSIPRVKERAILGIQMKVDTTPVVVMEVHDGSPAERAKLRAGDVIEQVDDVSITSPGHLKSEISRRAPGDMVTLRITRGEGKLTVRATLTKPFGDFQSRIAMQNQMGGDLSDRRTGFPAVLQHDTVLEPFECGGPLLDLSGQAIGINIARAGRTATYAIPDDVLRPLIDELLAGKYPPPGEQLPTIAADLADDAPAPPPESDTSRQ